ncbi:MAG: GNAT family N-acetyltransferase [Pseudomonadota bacterium]
MAAALSAHEGMPPPNLSRQKLFGAIFGPDACVEGLIASSDQSHHGYVLWTIGFDMQNGTRTLNIIDLFVEEPHRRTGIATSLLKATASVASERNYKLVTVQTFIENADANAFYPAIGAKLDRTNVYYFNDTAIKAL